MKVRIGYGLGTRSVTNDHARFTAFVDALEGSGFDSLWLSERLTGDCPDPVIGLAVAAAVAVGFKLPNRVDWRDVAVVGCAAGIGFTVALFFATAAFPSGPALDQAKLGALLSVTSAGVAYAAAVVLRVGRFRG